MRVRLLQYFLLVSALSLVSVVSAQITGIKFIGDPCTEFTIEMQWTGTSDSPYFSWNFDDPGSGLNDTITITGASFPVTNPTHTFSAIGIYNVCVSFQEQGMPVDTFCQTFKVGLCCVGVISFTDTCLENSIDFTIESDATVNSASWVFGDPASGSSNNSTNINPSHTFSSPGTYTVQAQVATNCSTFTVQKQITVGSCLNTNLPCDGTISFSDSCLQQGSTFNLTSVNPIDSIFWNFGDVASGASNGSSSNSPNHTFSDTGVYIISVIVYSSCGTYSDSLTIQIISCIPPPCVGDITFSDSCLTNGSTFRFNSTYALTGILWNFGDLNSGSGNTSGSLTPLHYFSRGGNFTVTFRASASCGIITDTLVVYIDSCLPPPPCTGNLSIMDTCLENGSRFQVTSFYPINSVNWDFGDVSSGIRNTSSQQMPFHNFSDTGRFNISASVTAGCGVFNITSTAFIISCIPPPCKAQIIANLDTCLSASQYFEILSTYPVDSIKWDFGDLINPEVIKNSNSVYHYYSSGNRYTIQSIVYLSCGIDTLIETSYIVNCDSIYAVCEVYLPNSFTPDGDGINDSYFAKVACPLDYFSLKIYNRWGQIIYETSDVNVRWDGNSVNNIVSSGIYNFLLEYKVPRQNMIAKRGMISVVR